MEIRYAKFNDLPALVDIYNFYVENHHSTFATEKTTIAARTPWFEKYNSIGPYRLLVAEERGILLGCAYSSSYRDHPAFCETIETSIYLAPASRGKGVGTALYSELFEKLRDEPLHLAVVGIALPNDSSIALHSKLGFKDVGIFKEYAKVNGRYFSSVWMQKELR